MNKIYLQAETPSLDMRWIYVWIRFCGAGEEGKKQDKTKFSEKVFAFTYAHSYAKTPVDPGPLGLGITKCRFLILICVYTRSENTV